MIDPDMFNRKKIRVSPLLGYGLLAILGIGFIVWSEISDNSPSFLPDQFLEIKDPQIPVFSDSTTDNNATLPTKLLISSVPFTSQAPLGEWTDPRQQGGCEEASVLIAGSWATQTPIGDSNQALQKILELSRLSEEMFGSFHDSSARDTLKLYQKYWQVQTGSVAYDIELTDIKKALADGQIVMVPADGRLLNNPNFTNGGPDRHMLVIIGYDDKTKMFTTSEPGTRKGANYRYSYEVMLNAINDYPTGDHLPITTTQKAMIIIPKN